MNETDLRLPDGRTLHVYDTHPGDDARVAVFWHHGTPNLGMPPEPLFEASDQLGLRWVSFDRPGYGGSTVAPGRTTGSVGRDVAHVADALGIGPFTVMGHSGGGSYALGCAAVLHDRVQAVVSLAGLAPYGVPGLDWFGGMIPSGVTALTAAREGREARAALDASGEQYDPEFAPVDEALFSGPWSWLGKVAGPALDAGPYGQIDDDVSYLLPWGAELDAVTAPVLLLHGGLDRIVPAAHSRWLAANLAAAELAEHPDDSHISILRHAEPALDWLRDRADQAR
ncbi:alpha/beta hydrolase fold protein [Kribbella flavida DSM 17836]|uniref:Alpha/beta hydrolase fold protein n=1 Tax=Kribbella flavida (strain DSM 17836 / JCM 10339 / NBRC 14399) TaxID=479435 RepID=D2Q496_KRIFD|nr:alpha/beta fold hydrolase [Kribbella flavida]ADB30410.1 alpha/beta hydrolase fold protein [Kribbella flavida DSM 17836]